QNCGNRGSGGVVKTISSGEPIVCDGGGTRMLNSTSSGEIKIDMDTGSVKEAAVTVKNGADITIIKKITVIKGSGSGLPVINVLN
ncbi:hypothetical protein, partial [Bartonella bovis]|uniref:hypothetical protein n=1 Tax=Bartonella bovis TaxID=155194 RepID=UPI001304A980